MIFVSKGSGAVGELVAYPWWILSGQAHALRVLGLCIREHATTPVPEIYRNIRDVNCSSNGSSRGARVKHYKMQFR